MYNMTMPVRAQFQTVWTTFVAMKHYGPTNRRFHQGRGGRVAAKVAGAATTEASRSAGSVSSRD